MPQTKIIRHESNHDRPERWDFDFLVRVISDHMIKRGPGWVTSREVACEIGYPWRVIARAMIKMTEIEKQKISWISSRQRERKCLAYRMFHGPKVEYPEWLVPKSYPVNANGRINRIDK